MYSSYTDILQKQGKKGRVIYSCSSQHLIFNLWKWMCNSSSVDVKDETLRCWKPFTVLTWYGGVLSSSIQSTTDPCGPAGVFSLNWMNRLFSVPEGLLL